MARFTITVSNERHQQLKMRAARRGKSIGSIIEEDLAFLDEVNRQRAMQLTARAQSNAAKAMAGLTDEEIENWVLAEMGANRSERRSRSAS